MGRILVEEQYFDIANIDCYDIIVGMAFMYEMPSTVHCSAIS